MLKILFFGVIRDQLAISELNVTYRDNQTTVQLLSALKARNPHWHTVLSKHELLVAVNHTLCTTNIALERGDEVAFFPPVTGG